MAARQGATVVPDMSQRTFNQHPDVPKSEIKLQKSNILMLGPTGSGKMVLVPFTQHFNSIPNSKSLALTKLKAFADDKLTLLR